MDMEAAANNENMLFLIINELLEKSLFDAKIAIFSNMPISGVGRLSNEISINEG